MSRSYKHSPICPESKNKKWFFKRYANKVVRQFKGELANGKAYRRLYNSWDICDYKFRETLEEAILDWEVGRWSWTRDMTREEVIQYWKASYYRK